MIQLFKILLISILFCSCNSKTDLEQLKYENNVSDITNANHDLKKDQDATYGLLSYRTDELENFSFGDVSFSKYSFPNGYIADYNELYIHIDNYKNKKFLGFTLDIVNQEEAKNLIDYLKSKYGKPESRDSNSNSFVWYNDKLNQWILINQNINETKDNKSFISTKCTIIKQGVRVENSNEPNVFTILDNFSLSHPKLK